MLQFFSSSVRRTLIRTFSLLFLFKIIISSLVFQGFRAECPEKSADRKAADWDCEVTIRCSLSPWTSAFSLPFSPNVVFLCLPLNLTAALPRSLPAGEFIARLYLIRTVIQLSGRLFALPIINWEIVFSLNEINFVNFPQTTKRAGTQHIKPA